MLESFILTVILTLANGETMEAIGEEYPTYAACHRANDREMKKIQDDIRRNPKVFRDMTYKCERLSVVGPEGVNLNVD